MQVAGGAGPVDASAGCQGTVLVKKGQAALDGANGAHDPVNEEGKKNLLAEVFLTCHVKVLAK